MNRAAHCRWKARLSMAGEVDMDADTPKAGRTPPYVSFKSLLTLVEELKTNGIPPQIDRSVLSRFSGGLGSQLVMAMKSLGMVTEDNKPTPRGVAAIKAFGTDMFAIELRPLIEQAYPFLRGIDLSEATPSMFATAFKTGTGAKEDVLRKCRTFFIHAAQYVGIPIGPRILSGSVPRSSTPGAVKRKPRTPKTPPADKVKEQQQHHTTTTSSVAQTLLAKFPEFDPSWSDDLKAKWFDGYGRLLAMGETKSG